MIELNKIYNEDCLVGMQRIPDKSIDMICCDLPYGVLNRMNPDAKWDAVIPFDKLWEQYERIIKDDGIIALFGQGMFTAKLMCSNEKLWRYNLIWKKGNRVSDFLNAKRKPLGNHEDIMIFYKKMGTYNPQMTVGAPVHSNKTSNPDMNNRCYGDFNRVDNKAGSTLKYPKTIVDIDKEHDGEQFHPTQKPVELIEWLIKTYTNEGETVLDNCMGSGTTAIACINTDRNYIGFEITKEYYDKIQERLKTHQRRRDDAGLNDVGLW